ncbi:unnamed protein product [Arabidopsis thaliana]|uniref:Uncharacterized protein n=1 Tax=Arabidopsis thaliana TaxID=3702 RepID=A0A5S9WY43_ARATH|nr:unnamed protein product [Arabidopsis thaliana]
MSSKTSPDLNPVLEAEKSHKNEEEKSEKDEEEKSEEEESKEEEKEEEEKKEEKKKGMTTKESPPMIVLDPWAEEKMSQESFLPNSNPISPLE